MAKIKKSYRYVDLIPGTHDILKLAELISQCLEEQTPDGQKQGKTKMVVDVWKDTDQIVEDLPVERRFPFESGVSIMFGCNNFCSYRIVPYVRGWGHNRRPEEIIREIRELATDGMVEVTLLGQNINSYGKNLDNPVTFAQFLEEVERIDGIRRIRFMTSHPKDLSDELIKVTAGPKKMCHHLHLPFQSGSSRILKVMNRCYTKEWCLDLAERIKRAVSDTSLTVDAIMGLPGETDEDFEETMNVAREMWFDSTFAFVYPKRTDIPATAIENQVPEEIVKERLDRSLKEMQDISVEMCEWDTETVQEVLVEEVNVYTPELTTDRLSNNTVVHFPGDPSMIGRLVPVYLRESREFYYMGYMADKESG